MADYADAAAGWEIYRDRNGNVSKSALNAALGSRGMAEIADRTYKHYGKLLLHGYTNYLSINRLDIKHANTSVFDTADRSRYVERTITTPGTLVVPRGSTVQRIAGSIIQVSDGFATLRTQDVTEAQTAANASKYDKGVLVFDQVGVERAVKVVEGLERPAGFDLLLSFRSLLEADVVVVDADRLPAGYARLVVNLGPESPMSTVLSSIHRTFDLMETSRGLVDILVKAAVSEQRTVLSATPRVQHLEVVNPLEVVFIGSVAVIGVMSYVVNRVTGMLGDGATVASQFQGLKNESSAEERRQQKHDLEMTSMQLDNVKKAFEIEALTRSIGPDLEE